MERHIQKTLLRLKARLKPHFESDAICEVFFRRLDGLFPDLLELLQKLYGDRYDFFYHLEAILSTAAQNTNQRSQALHELDAKREADPHWFQSEKMVGAVCYVDLFAGDLAGLKTKLPYLKELGITYLHLMPLFQAPDDNSDGGYAVSDFRAVNPKLGTMDELEALAADFRAEGISLVLDFVFNHTSDEHRWAQQALLGDLDYQDYYYMFPNRTQPDAYEKMLREIFPETAPGSFTYRPDIERWVWTTFNVFQWDLNYRNPEVFNAVLGEMLFLANVGVEVLRLDAVAFIWKEMGTTCENLPQAHWIIQAYNVLVRLAAPTMVFKSEAIVHPDEVAKYFGSDGKAECPISYNPTLMALLWETLATREVKLLRHSMQKRFAHPEGTMWVNYVRVHDDIGWSFADEDATEIGINGFDHRQFLNAFYSGNFAGSFAKGLLFNYNPLTRDARITGTCASLAGLETALHSQDSVLIDYAIRRILLIHSIIMSIGGLPLIYLGDEVGTLNDYSYEAAPHKALDNRWVHRPFTDWDKVARRTQADAIEARVFAGIHQMIEVRKSNPVFAVGHTTIAETGNPHVFGYTRWQAGVGFLALANFSEHEQDVNLARFQVYGLTTQMHNMLREETAFLTRHQTLQPYQFMWLSTQRARR